MLHRPAVASLLVPLLPVLVACSPAPRWIAVAAGDQRILFFDGRLRVTGSARLPLEPLALESTGDGASVLVGGTTSAQSGMVAWLRRSDGVLVVEQPTTGPVRALSLDRDGREALALTGGANGSLSIRSADRLSEDRSLPICAEPVALAFTREGDRAYVTCRPGAVAEVDPKLEIVVQTTFVAADSGRACGAGRGVLSSNGTLLYVPCAATGRVLYLDRVTLRPWDSVSVGAGVSALAVTPGAIAVALLPDSGSVALVDLRRKRRVATIATSPNPVDVTLGADGRTAFVLAAGSAGDGALLQIDTQTGAITARTAVPAGGRAVYVWPGGREVRMHWVGSGPSLQPSQPGRRE